MLPLRSRVRQAAHVRQIVLQQSPVDRLRPRVEPLPSPPLEVRDVHQRAVCRGRPDPLARHPHPGDLLDHLTKPPSLDQGEVHPHRDPAVTGAELLIHLAHPHVRVTVIKPELRSAEPVNDPTHERHLAPIGKLRADPRGVQLEHRAHTGPLEMPQQTGPPAATQHDRVVTIVPALKAVAQLDLEQSADRKPVGRATAVLGAQRPGAGQPRLHVARPVVAVVVQMGVADVHAAGSVQRSPDRQLTARNRAVRPIQPRVIRVRDVRDHAELGADRSHKRLPPIRLGSDQPQQRGAHTRSPSRSSIPAAASSRRRSSASRWL